MLDLITKFDEEEAKIYYESDNHINCYKEIERLQFKNKKLQTILRTRARQDRKRKAKVRKYREELTNQRLKLERLNNIINELEKWLEQEYAIVKSNSIIEPNNPEWYIKWNERKNTLDKLQELKGSVSNE